MRGIYMSAWGTQATPTTKQKTAEPVNRFDESYYKNITKVMGGSLSRIVSTKKISFKLYNHLKFNLRNIVQYEFTF